MKGNILVLKNSVILKKNAIYSKLFGLQVTETQFRHFKQKKGISCLYSLEGNRYSL